MGGMRDPIVTVASARDRCPLSALDLSKSPARRPASAGCNVSQVGTLNQSGMRPAVRRCPRRAVAHAEQTGDNRTSGITMNASSAPLTAVVRQPCAAQAGVVDPGMHRSPTRTR